MSSIDDQFEEIAQRVSREAASVKCSPEDYRAGLRGIIETLKTDIRASEETSGNTDEE